MGDSLHSDGKNELVTGYVPCGLLLSSRQRSSGDRTKNGVTPMSQYSDSSSIYNKCAG